MVKIIIIVLVLPRFVLLTVKILISVSRYSDMIYNVLTRNNVFEVLHFKSLSARLESWQELTPMK